MKVVVTGGSGQLGTVLLRKLIKIRKIKSIVSIDKKPPVVASKKIRAVDLDVRSPNVGQFLEGADVLIHLAFVITNKMPRSAFDDINIEGSKNVFRAAVDAGVKRIMYASSIAQYGVVPGHPSIITEETPRKYQPDFPYSAAKHSVEEFLDGLNEDHPDLRITRFRPSILVGTHFGNPLAALLGQMLDRGRIIETSTAPMPVVWDEDVADAFVLAVKKDVAGAFNVTGDDPIAAAELAAELGLKLVRVPKPILHSLSAVSDLMSRFGRGEAVDASWKRSNDVTMVTSSEKAKKELGWKPKSETCAQVFQRYLDESPGKTDVRITAFMRMLSFAVKRAPIDPEIKRDRGDIHLRLTGKGGGDYAVYIRQGRITVKKEIPRPPSSVAEIPASLFIDMLAGKETYFNAQLTNKIRIGGDQQAGFVVGGLVTQFRSQNRKEDVPGRVARVFSRWLGQGGTS